MSEFTPNLNLEKPDFGSERWDLPINNNSDIIDDAVAGKLDTVDLDAGINEYLQSGEATSINIIGSLTLGHTIYFTSVADPSYEDMFLRIGPGGGVNLYRMPNDDKVWAATDATDHALTSTSTEILSLVVDQDLLPEDSSFQASGSFDNSSNKDRTVVVEAYDDGVLAQTQEVVVLADAVGQLFLFSGSISGIIATGSTLTINFSEEDGDVILRGSVTQTRFAVTKAGGDPVTRGQYNVDQDLYEAPGSIGPTLTRAEIESIVATPYPTSFAIRDTSGRMFLCFYDIAGDKFYYERLTEAT